MATLAFPFYTLDLLIYIEMRVKLYIIEQFASGPHSVQTKLNLQRNLCGDPALQMNGMLSEVEVTCTVTGMTLESSVLLPVHI